jgi:L-lactate dehydrogenase complex protein LldG
VQSLNDVPEEVAQYLANNNLPSQVRMAADPMLAAISWDKRPTLEILTGRAQEPDHVSVTGAFAAIAETGTLMMISGPEHPTTLNFLPDTHILVLRADQVVGPYEEAWDRLRQRSADTGRGMPRTVNLITGPSRTGDIEQTILLGAHGPRRMHIVLVEAADA